MLYKVVGEYERNKDGRIARSAFLIDSNSPEDAKQIYRDHYNNEFFTTRKIVIIERIGAGSLSIGYYLLDTWYPDYKR